MKLKFNILQLDAKQKTSRPFLYQGWEKVENLFDISRYDRVWSDEWQQDANTSWVSLTAVLDGIFERFNNAHPDGYNGRSLSISDIVEFPDLGLRFYCDYCGWTTIFKNS